MIGYVRDCDYGRISWCYPGEINVHYNPDGSENSREDLTYATTCH
jgi:hypothetical protein